MGDTPKPPGWIWLLPVAALGCAPAAPIVPPSPPPAAPTAAPDLVPAPVPSAEPEIPPPPAAPDPPPAPAAPFPPPSFRAPFERTAAPGDGVWEPFVPASAGGPALLYRTTVHPERMKPQVYVAVVAIDLDRVGLRFVAGTIEPRSTTVPAEHRPGLVSPADLPLLIAVLNGGFMTRHGTWGAMAGGEVLLPPHDDGCTVGLYRNDSVRIRTFTELAASVTDMTAYRQTPPCLVERGTVNEVLLGGDKPRRWGLSETGGVDIRRSALGVAAGGRTLLYGSGEWVTPRALAEAMRAAGAIDAAELDVNWSFTRFLLYGPGSPPEVTATLVPKTKHATGLYVAKPSERDFFYLVRRQGSQ